MNSEAFSSLAHLRHLSGFPIRLFSEETLVFPEKPDVSDVFLCDRALLERTLTAQQAIVIDTDYPDIVYGQIEVGAYTCVVGPLKRETLFQDRLREYFRRHHANNGPTPEIPTGSFTRLNDVLILASRLLDTRTKIEAEPHDPLSYAPAQSAETDGAIRDFQTGYYLQENAEGGVRHTPYELESRALKALEDGDEQEFYRIMGEIQSYSGGSFAASQQKYLEYSAVSMVTLLTRAAIRGGVPQQEAYAISDLLLNRASRARSEQEHILILQDAVAQFLRGVKKYRSASQHSYHIRKCKAYIAANLNQPLSPESLATHSFGPVHAESLSKNYSMTLFSAYEGEPLMRYVQRKRIQAAADMLKYSDHSILYIANYYQFQTQSHFGAAFKKLMGTSPAAYRNTHRPVG